MKRRSILGWVATLAGLGCALLLESGAKEAMAADQADSPDPKLNAAEGCNERAADIALFSKEMEIAPSGAARIIAVVTCGAVPLAGAEIALTIEPQPGSGGHLHYDGRPRGSLEGHALSGETPFLAIKSGVDGRVDVRFEPPGKTPKSRGIGLSGVYEIRAHVAGAPDRVATLPIIVRVPGLVLLDPEPDGPLTIIRAGMESHPDGTYGTPATVDALRSLAGWVVETQRTRNKVLQACGKEPWLVWQLSVNDVSLPWGGLFDYKADWSPPHQMHGLGVAADINHFFAEGRNVDCEGREVSLDAWLMAVLLEYGREFGTWDAYDLAQPSRLLHLNVKN